MTNPHKGRTGVTRVAFAVRHSLSGLRAAWREESAFRQECALAIFMLPGAFWLGQSWLEVALLAGSAVMVLVIELLNSAIEATVDRVSFETHDLSKRAKDMASAAVMLSLLTCTGIWVMAAVHRFTP